MDAGDVAILIDPTRVFAGVKPIALVDGIFSKKSRYAAGYGPVTVALGIWFYCR